MSPAVEHPDWCERELCSFGREAGRHQGHVAVIGEEPYASAWIAQERTGPPYVSFASGVPPVRWSAFQAREVAAVLDTLGAILAPLEGPRGAIPAARSRR